MGRKRKSFGSFLDASFMSIDATMVEHASDNLSFTPELSLRKKRKRDSSRQSLKKSKKRSSLRDISNNVEIISARKRKIRSFKSTVNKKRRVDNDLKRLKTQAERAYGKGNYEIAKQYYNEILISFPAKENDILPNIALCELFLGQYCAALLSLRRSTTQALQKIFLEAKILIFQGFVKDAMPLVECILTQNNHEKNDFELLRHIDLKEEASLLVFSCEKYQRLMSDIRKNLNDEKPVVAFQKARDCEEISPKCRRVWLAKVVSNFLSIALFKSSTGLNNFSNVSEADISTDQLKQVSNKNKALQKELKEILRDSMNEKDSSKHLMEEALQYGLMFYNQAFLNEANQLFKAVAKISGNKLASLMIQRLAEMEKSLVLGVGMAKKKEFKKAIEHFSRCLTFDIENLKFNGRVYFRRAQAFFHINESEKAIADLKQCIECIPMYEKAVLKLVEVLKQKERYSECLEYLESLFTVSRKKELGYEIRKLRLLKEKQDFLNNSKKFKTPPRRHRYNTRLSAKLQRKQKTLYEVLGVTRRASKATIKKAYRKLALKLHPDKQSEEVTSASAKEKFQELNSAYSVLSSPSQKKRYDKSLQ